MVDDLPKYVNDATRCGIPVVYFTQDRPWQTPLEHALVRSVRCWQDVPAALDDLLRLSA